MQTTSVDRLNLYWHLQELAEKKAELQRREAGVKCVNHPSTETRTVEELLSFIEEEERQGQSKKQGKRKKPRKKKDSSGDNILGAAGSSERNSLDKGGHPRAIIVFL